MYGRRRGGGWTVPCSAAILKKLDHALTRPLKQAAQLAQAVQGRRSQRVNAPARFSVPPFTVAWSHCRNHPYARSVEHRG